MTTGGGWGRFSFRAAQRDQVCEEAVGAGDAGGELTKEGETGVNEVTFKTAQVYEYEHGNDLIPLREKYSRYRQNRDGTWVIKNKLLNHCWRMWHSCVITWDGKIVPCCFDKDASHVMGSLQEKKFSEIWNGAGYQKFRQSLLKSRC